MSQKERNEWIERAKERVLANAREADSYVRDIMDLYDETANMLEMEINAMFRKYAGENGLTAAEAEKLLTGDEYSRWRKSIDRYVEEARTDSRTLRELNTLSAKSRISRKEQLLSQIYRNMINLSGDTEAKLTELLKDRYKVNYYRGCYDIQSILKIAFPVAKVDETMLRRILEYPWSGKNYSQALWGNTDQLAAVARREITMGFMSGASVQKMAKSIDDIMGRGRYAAERLVRTESSYFSNQGELASYRETGTEEYIFMGGGCPICAEIGGCSFRIDEAEVGVNLPPMHPNCKCTTRAKAKIDLFRNREGAEPLKNNPKFEEWKKKYVDRNGQAPIMKLTDDEQYSVNSFISGAAYTWNDKLRRHVKLTKAEETAMKHMDAALDKMPTYKGVLYRSVSGDMIPDIETFIASHVVGTPKQFDEYLSCSTEVYDESFPIQYVIQAKTARDIRRYNEAEKELVFKRDMLFLITRIVDHVIYMEEI